MYIYIYEYKYGKCREKRTKKSQISSFKTTFVVVSPLHHLPSPPTKNASHTVSFSALMIRFIFWWFFFYVKMKYHFPNRMYPHHQVKMPVTLFLFQIWMIWYLWNWFIFTKFYAHIFVMVFKTGMPEVNIVNSVKQYPLPLIA